jgi:hypothetical protein
MSTDGEGTLLPFNLPSIGKKKIPSTFDGGQTRSDWGVLLQAGVDHGLGLIDRLAALPLDHGDPAHITRKRRAPPTLLVGSCL